MTLEELSHLTENLGETRQRVNEFSERLTTALVGLQSGVKPGADDPVLALMLGPKLVEVVRKVRWGSLVINPGSTSTKVAVYNGLTLVASDELRHPRGSPDGTEERVQQILAWLDEKRLRLAEITGVGARGGFVAPVPCGTYRISPAMLEDLAHAPYPHASNLSVPMALQLGERIGPEAILTITDPVTCDEIGAAYRLTGSPRIRNDGTAVHYLNHRATAGLVSQLLGCPTHELHLITCHMGGGMSAARHANARVVQVIPAFGALPSANRSGALPLHQVIRRLEDHSLSLDELKRDVLSEGGLVGLAGTDDFKTLFSFARKGASPEQRRKIELLVDFFASRVAAAILDLAAAERPVDAAVLSGGLAHDAEFCRKVAARIHLGIPLARIPGSVEGQALAAGLLRACAEPETWLDYTEARDALAARRVEEEKLLSLPLFASGLARRSGPPRRLSDLVSAASSGVEPMCVAVVGADNEEALLAAKLAVEEGHLARFLLVGPHGRVSQLSWELDVPIDDENFLLVDAADPVARAMELLQAGLCDTLMKGSVMTAALLKGYLGYLKGKGLTGHGLLLSHIGLFEIPGRGRLVAITDAAINTAPDVEARVRILENALSVLHLLGFACPKVAVVSAVEKVSRAVTSSVEGEAIAARFAGRTDLIIEGPLSVDLSLSPDSAREKHYRGQIQGDADLLLVPDLDVGNAIYKAFTVTSGAALAGAVIGGEAPFVLTSRGDSSKSKLASLALALLLTRMRKEA